MKDFYKILGIEKNASPEDVKRAYRKLAHQHHPDKKGGDEKKFKEINEAYQILGDVHKRSQYDRFGSAGFGENAGGQYGSGFEGFSQDFGRGFEGVDLGDIFEEIFSGFSTRSQKTRAARGADVAVDIEISFHEAAFGVKRNLSLDLHSTCRHCNGKGSEPGSKITKCEICQGTGQIKENRKSFFGSFTSVTQCSKCKGTGEIPEKVCHVCKGSKIVRERKSVEIDIPAGIRDGEAIKISEGGEASAGGATGDLYVRVHVMPHATFHREGYDILFDLHVQMSTLLKGGEQTIETLDGKVSVSIPELSQPGDLLRLRGKGIPKSRGSRGDFLIRLHPQIPRRLSSKARQLLDDLEKEGL